uniref:3',5'-cyclic AMP phosphodiesterase CpdA n=1 Tax=Candidatus Kentrum sp. DK TaxID=2126562 RepID=A0A450RVE6_9GAMM|nr:MAG: 3',5'-cyclic AMP phosphodiesterase CpdA [Candidatus Kentron sp. DK]VFJ45197.1 MAG: 3',5'-cyclic AMP phosphodiesterase CpdA [Candidatus Kentron sp. DK]
MTRLIWITDPHLDFLEPGQTKVFLREVADVAGGDAVVITGDITVARVLAGTLHLIRESIPRVFFVLGNHDAYGGSIAESMEVASRFPGYLTALIDPVMLTPDTCLIGHDGWADGRLGNYSASPVMLNDYVRIQEFAGLSRAGILAKLHALGDMASAAVRVLLTRALKSYSHVILATHVPPVREDCWQGRKESFDDWAPHFFSKSLFDVLLEIMGDHPGHRLTVLGGHIHRSWVYRPVGNITVHTGSAEYRKPAIQKVFSVEDW